MRCLQASQMQASPSNFETSFNNTVFPIKDVRVNGFCASLLRTQIHMPRHA